MTNPELWGNPEAKTFKKRFIRTVQVGLVSVQVHQEIHSAVASVVRSALAAGVQLPERLDGWIEYLDGFSHREYGLAFGCLDGPAFPPSTYRHLGFVEDSGLLVFTGTPEDAKAASLQAEVDRVSVVTAPQESKSEWATDMPGERELFKGDKGDDVLCWQLTVNAQEQSGVFEHQSVAHAAYLQSRLGVKVTGTVNADLWNHMMPNTLNYNVAYGETNNVIRFLQAVFVAYGWEAPGLAVTGRFDQPTLGAVRNLQKMFDLRQTGEMGLTEWAALTGRKVRVV